MSSAAVDLAKPGAYLTLRNAKIDMFRGSMRLAVNQAGAARVARKSLPAVVVCIASRRCVQQCSSQLG